MLTDVLLLDRDEDLELLGVPLALTYIHTTGPDPEKDFPVEIAISVPAADPLDPLKFHSVVCMTKMHKWVAGSNEWGSRGVERFHNRHQLSPEAVYNRGLASKDAALAIKDLCYQVHDELGSFPVIASLFPYRDVRMLRRLFQEAALGFPFTDHIVDLQGHVSVHKSLFAGTLDLSRGADIIVDDMYNLTQVEEED